MYRITRIPDNRKGYMNEWKSYCPFPKSIVFFRELKTVYLPVVIMCEIHTGEHKIETTGTCTIREQ